MKAVVFVDVQKDFIDGALRNEKAINVTPKIVEFAKTIVNDDCKIYATRDTHTEDYLNTLEGQKLPVTHCVEGSDGWMIDDNLMNVIYGKCTFVNKPTFGSFDLAEIISEDFNNENLDEIIICGFCTDICVAANASILRAKFPNVKISVMKDLCAGVTEDSHNAALTAMKMQQIDII